jgi:hypothetical protein
MAQQTQSVGRAIVFKGLLVLSAFLFLFVATKDAGKPGGAHASLYALLLLCCVATVAGAMAQQYLKIPALTGMIVAGVALRNTGAIDGLPHTWMSILKAAAEAIIMLRAGMGLDLSILKKSGGMFFGLAVIPGLVEAAVAALLSTVVFKSYGLDIKWGFMLGFVLSDVSPAVTVPILLEFILQGYGSKSGVPTVLLAAGGINGIMSITLFGICEGFVFATAEPVWLTCVLGVVEIVGGLVLGILMGAIVTYTWDWAPQPKDQSRFMLVLVYACIGIFFGKYLKMGGGGTLATITMGVVMKHCLHTKMRALEGLFKEAWNNVGQVLLFGLLGAQVSAADGHGCTHAAHRYCMSLRSFLIQIAGQFQAAHP